MLQQLSEHLELRLQSVRPDASIEQHRSVLQPEIVRQLGGCSNAKSHDISAGKKLPQMLVKSYQRAHHGLCMVVPAFYTPFGELLPRQI